MGGRATPIADLAVPGSLDEYLLDMTDRKRSLADELSGRGLQGLLQDLRALGL
jgi:hypothetical protein